MTVPPQAVEPRFAWVLGRERYQRLYIRFWLMTSSVYLVVFSLLLFSVPLGLMGPRDAAWVAGLCLAGIATFYGLMRSGWSMRLADPALTAPQMGFAFIMLAVAYVLAPPLRATLLIITPLVLVFGAFTLSQRHCRQLGLFAVLTQACATAWSVLVAGGSSVEWLVLVCCGVVYTMAADMAGRLSAIRQQLREQKKALAAALAQNEQLARQDDLTGLPNRRHAMEMMEYEERRAKREKVPPCVCMIDLDHFKRINDTYGHAAGDIVLQKLAQVAVPALRAPDILARWGGEEFILLMPETTLEEATQVVGRLRSLLAQPHLWTEYPQLQVTFSAGIATLLPSETVHDAVQRADVALYRAKENGRNRSELAQVAGDPA